MDTPLISSNFTLLHDGEKSDICKGILPRRLQRKVKVGGIQGFSILRKTPQHCSINPEQVSGNSRRKAKQTKGRQRILTKCQDAGFEQHCDSVAQSQSNTHPQKKEKHPVSRVTPKDAKEEPRLHRTSHHSSGSCHKLVSSS